jgi:hypothetical protein
MTSSSLFRVSLLVGPVLLACAHEVDEFPEHLADDNSPVVGSAGSSSLGGSGRSLQAPPGGAGKSGGSSAGGSGQAGAPSAKPSPSAGAPPALEPEAGAGDAAGGELSVGGSAAGAAATGGSGSAGMPPVVGGVGGSGAVGAQCSNVPTWAAGSYEGGARVRNAVSLYECKPFPYSGWCGMPAYAPGAGFAWTDAWTLIGPC